MAKAWEAAIQRCCLRTPIRAIKVLGGAKEAVANSPSRCDQFAVREAKQQWQWKQSRTRLTCKISH